MIIELPIESACPVLGEVMVMFERESADADMLLAAVWFEGAETGDGWTVALHIYPDGQVCELTDAG